MWLTLPPLSLPPATHPFIWVQCYNPDETTATTGVGLATIVGVGAVLTGLFPAATAASSGKRKGAKEKRNGKKSSENGASGASGNRDGGSTTRRRRRKADGKSPARSAPRLNATPRDLAGGPADPLRPTAASLARAKAIAAAAEQVRVGWWDCR